MKIAILGTRGIPNSYGGFEKCAERLSLYFLNNGHEVTVYNPDTNPYLQETWRGVNLKTIFSRENILGIIGNFIFDFLSLRDSLNEKFDVILELGYSPSSFFYFLKSKKNKTLLVTNMDGMEWKRAKWNFLARKILQLSEKLAVHKSDVLISDNPEIQNYLKEKYNRSSCFIPYGAEPAIDFKPDILKKYRLKNYEYFLIISRIEPENNIEMILKGFIRSGSKFKFVVVGNSNTKYGKYLSKTYDKYLRVKFIGGIYDQKILDTLRHYSKIYFHGHSVGGTNPSLLEAMASQSNIAVHENKFNRSVIGEDALYFRDSSGVCQIIKETVKINSANILNNLKKIKTIYNWNEIGNKYIEIFEKNMYTI